MIHFRDVSGKKLLRITLAMMLAAALAILCTGCSSGGGQEDKSSGLTAAVPDKKDGSASQNDKQSEPVTILFGHYEQDGDTANGPEPIEWIVLEENGDEKTLISRYLLDAAPYHKENDDVTWEKCSLRTWLNNEFADSAFSGEEKKQLIKRTVAAEKNPESDTDAGSDTKDSVWLLSIGEARRYFGSDAARLANPAENAALCGAWVNELNGGGWWWLRTPGCVGNRAAYVDGTGNVYQRGDGVDDENVGIRPVIVVRMPG